MSEAVHEPAPTFSGARALGLLPLVFLAVALSAYESRNRLHEALWLCNVANLVLAIGLLSRTYRLIWLGTICAVVGVPLWTWDAVLNSHFNQYSILTHVGAAALGISVLWRRGAIRHTWMLAMALGLSVQFLCRMTTRPELNVNASHAPYQGVEALFSSYLAYWLANLLVMSVYVFAIDWLLARFVARRERAHE